MFNYIVKYTCIYIYTGCNTVGFYGSNCETPCPKNCEDSTCHIQNGTCFTCKPGWIGIQCNSSKMTNIANSKCSVYCFGIGYYSISVIFKNETVSFFCITECGEGWYGFNCSQPCKGHCRELSTCNHVTGECNKGCDIGWTGAFCNKGCTRICYFT